MKKLRVIIAGGGTGGHIFPAVAIARALQLLNHQTELLFVGALGKMEMERVPKEGYKIVGLDIAGFNRSNVLKNIALPLKLLKSRLKAKEIIADFKPDVVIGVGGYASFPILNAAQSMGVPTLIQEQNSYAGRSNKILGRRAKSVCVAYEKMDRFFPKQKIILTGNPVRKEIVEMAMDQSTAIANLGLDASRKTILVVGGSLGAVSVNESIDGGLDPLLAEGVQLIWQTGKIYYEKAQLRARGHEARVKVLNFITNMPEAYAAADLVISRAGALAIAELCIVAKPVIFVPYPFAAENHQESNAMYVVENGGAVMIHDKDASSTLVSEAIALLNDEHRKLKMTQVLEKLAIKDADNRIAMKVMELAAN